MRDLVGWMAYRNLHLSFLLFLVVAVVVYICSCTRTSGVFCAYLDWSCRNCKNGKILK
jgi:hypothetical protein